MIYRKSVLSFAICCLLAVSASLSACGPSLVHHAKVDYAEEAANVYVSAYPAIPWSDISDKLEPNNNVSIEQARTLAAQTTQVQVAQFISTFAAGLGLGLPYKSENMTTNIAADGSETTTGTKSHGYGNIPAASGMPSTSMNPAPTTDLAKGLATPGIDGNTLLMAGTALYQQAKILDNQISKGLLPDKYQAHLITLQIDLQPKQRSVSYDAYVDISLMPGNWSEALALSKTVSGTAGGLPPVIVYPLIIMDALETSNVGRSIAAMRQAALTLSGVIGNIGANMGGGGGTSKLDSIVGVDKNSLITVGRVSDNTIRVRLGAENSGSAGLALVPRTYNISLVALTRHEQNPSNDDEPLDIVSLSAISHTTLYSTETGSALISGPNRDRQTLALAIKHRVQRYGFNIDAKECAVLKPVQKEPKACDELDQNYNCIPISSLDAEASLDLLRAVERADYNYIDKCLDFSTKRALNEVQWEIKLQRLLASLMEYQIDSRYASMQIPLKKWTVPQLPPSTQRALYTDDGKQMQVALRGGKGLTSAGVYAGLHVKESTNKKAFYLLPTKVTVSNGGAEVDVFFPSLSQFEPASEFGDAIPFRLSVDDTEGGCDGAKPKRCRQFGMLKIREEKSKEEAPATTVTASTTVLVADQNNVARVSVRVGAIDTSKLKGQLMLAIEGADLRQNAAIGSPAPMSRGIAVKPDSVITLELGNLTPLRQVKITAVDSAAKSVVPLGAPVTFVVERVCSGAVR